MLCNNCNAVNNVQQIIDLGKEENWRGQVTKASKNTTKKSRTKSAKLSKYLDQNQTTFDSLFQDNLQKVPILKNGNALNLKGVKIKKQLYSFYNTCAIDSIVQSFIVGAIDHSEVENALKTLQKDCPFIALTLYIKKMGVAQSYVKRGRILLEFHESAIQKTLNKTNNELQKVIHVDCNTNAFDMMLKLIEKLPINRIVINCNNGCPQRTRETNYYFLDNLLFKEALSEVEMQEALTADRDCSRRGCLGQSEVQYDSSGPIILIQLTDIRTLTHLDNIPIKFSDVLGTSDYYLLVGVIRYINNDLTSTNGLGKLSMGHYTTICRRNNLWTEFTNLNAGTQRTLTKDVDKKVNIEFLIYIKVEKTYK
ncbi:uncharacterized protein LOC126882697 [Diabrotica virgifera virgifera]|uniref:Uncharacterized protein n=1 Tax=Diabrotica virgifera virgifera TaxID=50390 RepID=A0ABM5K0B7_DIAVI|nr:uncharacterized protein LOC126882697 [Diabrotica virgifera virgifera]